MKLVDILFVLTAAATANAILPPADKDGSPKASRTLSQVFGPTNEPDPKILEEDWQSLMDEINSSILDENWQNIFDPIDPSTSDQEQQQSIDVAGPSIPKRGRKRLIDVVDTITSYQDWKQPIDQPSSSTSSQVSGPTDKPDSNTPKNWKELFDKINLNIPKDWRHPMDVTNPSTSKRGRKKLMNQPSSSTHSQVSGPIDVTNPSTSKRGRKKLMNQPSSSTPSQVSGPIDVTNPSTFKRGRKKLMNQPSSSTSKRGRKRPVDKVKPVTNQMIVLNKKDQKTFDSLKKRMEDFEKILKEKRRAYFEYATFKSGQRLALTIGKERFESKYSLEVQKQLKKEYQNAHKRLEYTRKKLKRFMEEHDLD
ncbi:hypothetical protein BATDEDRAFT_92204 [Batrachochytrium dendrobatidis JAM81]|uniref:Uncharacterized protein n=2 Tax=Batrachochytrium dendrobatidis TaxID=109871 RepID=F4PD65_BATDJ|nr:uncharacterized protein BATDEDRAFT_92204 [Batrachochytrium dendrobatidis JAM81]EGF77040.1 hypothetical protein BATDEDRAFT_92204 [Batrachochytrium dendrobatidis JAM81]OAJ45133.1 hypothetical protein BDEG_28294 [Batrachochytrium dendrobatidis JEL423]|eukprot:XP_006682548.1 hypothetical protein BATDEDRAFT_92204 [Batrachochytrium dendrobatidis JAM81]